MKEKITTYQLLAIMIFFPYGTAALFFLAPETKNSVWIALIFWGIISIFVQMIYVKLFYLYPNDTFISYLPKIYGKRIGFMLGIIYIIYFIYMGSRNLRDYGELIVTFALPHSSLEESTLFLAILIAYSVYKGIENIASMGQFIIITVVIIKILAIIMLGMSGVFHPYLLRPILEDGFKDMLIKSWKLSVFPYGELFIFTMIYPFVIQRSKVKKTVIFATILEIILLCINNMLFLLTLGYKFAALNNYPLLETYRLIHIGEFINRLDSFFIIILVEGGFFKVSIWAYCAFFGINQLFKVKSKRILSIFLILIIFVFSNCIANNHPQNINIGLNLVIKYISFPLAIAMPFLTYIIYYIKSLITVKLRG
ncbi:MAG: GerAB/ArcD/ProY family transporter [Clostridium sp.]|nr:GerAB/ArcD/ProY family transporter [Clostridium sp.]